MNEAQKSQVFNFIAQKQLSIKINDYVYINDQFKFQEIPIVISVVNLKQIYLEEDDGLFYARFVYMNETEEEESTVCCLGLAENEIALASVIKRYKTILETYENLILSDGGVVFEVKKD